MARLVLVAATPRFNAGDDWEHGMPRQTFERFSDELRVAPKAAVLRFLSLQVHGREHARATLASMRERLFARGEPVPATLAGALEILDNTDLRADVAAPALPTLLVTGDRDTVVSPGATAWLAGHMPDAEFVRIAGAAHAPFLSHPGAFDAAVESFLDADRAAA